jgi:hypothetical protein
MYELLDAWQERKIGVYDACGGLSFLTKLNLKMLPSVCRMLGM